MNRLILLTLVPLAFMLVLWGCDNDTTNKVSGPGATDKSCLGCHESEEMLKASMPEVSGSKVLVAHKDDG